jgi:hypothetical protein
VLMEKDFSNLLPSNSGHNWLELIMKHFVDFRNCYPFVFPGQLKQYPNTLSQAVGRFHYWLSNGVRDWLGLKGTRFYDACHWIQFVFLHHYKSLIMTLSLRKHFVISPLRRAIAISAFLEISWWILKVLQSFDIVELIEMSDW